MLLQKIAIRTLIPKERAPVTTAKAIVVARSDGSMVWSPDVVQLPGSPRSGLRWPPALSISVQDIAAHC